MIKVIKKYTEVSMILFSIVLLQISNLLQWDNNPIMGVDKVFADTIIIVLCCLMINKLGIQSGAGFIKKGFFKGIVYGIPFFVIGVASIFVSNVGLNWGQLSFLGISHLVLFTINMLLVGANEEIWMRSLVLNSFISKYGAGRKSLWKAIIMSAIIFGLIHIPNLFFMEPLTVIVQVINAMSAGILFAVIFVKCKNIWAGIIVHAIVDWCSLFIGNCFVGGNTVLSMSMNGIQVVSMILAGSLPPIIFSAIYMRKIEES